MDCGKVHFEVMSQLGRYKLSSKIYHDFLVNTLNRIEFPQEDDRGIYILRFFGNDGIIDETEWECGLKAARKVGGFTLSSYLRAMLLPNDDNAAPEQVLNRARIILQEAKDGKIGLPVPLDFHTVYFALMRAFSYNYAKNNIYI